MKDCLYRGLIEDIKVRFSYSISSKTCNDLILAHNCDPAAAHILGRATCAGLLLSPSLGEEERLNIQWHYEGAIRSLMVDVNDQSEIRALISPTNLSGHASKQTLYGPKALMKVMKSRQSAVLSSGTTESILADEVNDLAYYFSFSDQIETGMLVMIGFNNDPKSPVSLTQGLMIQAMPDCDLEQFERLRQRLDSKEIRELLSQCSESDNHLEKILKTLLSEEDIEPKFSLFDCPEPKFSCGCSINKMAVVMKSFSYNDRMDMVKKGEDIRINCNFCGKLYALSINDCIKIWNDKWEATEED